MLEESQNPEPLATEKQKAYFLRLWHEDVRSHYLPDLRSMTKREASSWIAALLDNDDI